MNEAKLQANIRKMEEREKRERCKNKEKAIMAVDTSDEFEYIRVEGMIDSGALDTIRPMELVGGNEVRETETSKSNECYSACNGTKVENKGCTTIEGESDEGIKIKFVSQIGGGMRKMLISVRKAVESRNMIIFGANAKAIKRLAKLNEIEDKEKVEVRSGTRGMFKSDARGNYVYPIRSQ